MYKLKSVKEIRYLRKNMLSEVLIKFLFKMH